jgi:RNA polymerase sigma-70 factor (ECF subfamily)
VDGERARHYKAALATLSDEERMLVVGRIELGFNYDQLALISGRATPEAARQAVRRAVKKLAERMPRGRGPR